MRSISSTFVALLVIGCSLAAAHPHIPQEEGASQTRRSAVHILQSSRLDARGAKAVAILLNSFEKCEPLRKLAQSADEDLVDAKDLKLVANVANDVTKRGCNRQITHISDNDSVDTKGFKVFVNALNDFERRADSDKEAGDALLARDVDAEERHERRSLFSYSDDDVIDLEECRRAPHNPRRGPRRSSDPYPPRPRLRM